MKVLESTKDIEVLDKFYLPPFSVNEGSLHHFFIRGGGYYWQILERIIPIFLNQKTSESVNIYKTVCFAGAGLKRIGYIKGIFSPTLQEYIEKNINVKRISQEHIQTIYHNSESDKSKLLRTKINKLPTDLHRFISILSCFSKADVVVFNFLGISPIGTEYIFSMVKNIVKEKKYTAIILDDFLDVDNLYDSHTEIQFKK